MRGAWGMTEATALLLRKAAIDGIAKFAVKLGTATPYYWCTGYEKVSIGGDVYTPKGMKVPDLKLSSGEAKAELTLEDIPNPDGSPYKNLAHHNYNERFSGKELLWYFGSVVAGAWSPIYSITWYVESCHFRLGQFILSLSGTTGKYPRAGLPMFSRRCNLIYKGVLCSTGPSTGFGTYDTCSGSWADCELRHGTADANNPIPFRGLLLAPEVGQTIKLNEYSSTSFGHHGSGDKPTKPTTHNPWGYLQVYHPEADMVSIGSFVSAAISNNVLNDSGPSSVPIISSGSAS